MSNEVEVVSDGEGAFVIGPDNDVHQFMKQHGIADTARPFDFWRLRKILSAGAILLEGSSAIAEQSSMYLKLTPESKQRLIDAGGLMPTKIKGISHAMLGKTGDASMKWLQVDSKLSSSIITNPATLAGIGGILSQAVRQVEAQELRKFFIRIDDKLDSIHRNQRNTILAQVQAAAVQLEEAQIMRSNGGDPRTLWDKVRGTESDVIKVREQILLELAGITKKARQENKPKKLTKLLKETENDIDIHLSVLSKCLELEDLFQVIEIDHVMTTAADFSEGHLKGASEARKRRREDVMDRTKSLINELDRVASDAISNTIIHPIAARSITDSVNIIRERIEEFYEPLGKNINRVEIELISWHKALRQPAQIYTAIEEIGPWVQPFLPAIIKGGATLFKSRSK